MPVRVRLNGGLGNQMFQYAAGKALARRIGASLQVDAQLLRSGMRRYCLGAFALEVTRRDEATDLWNLVGRKNRIFSRPLWRARSVIQKVSPQVTLGRFEEGHPYLFDSGFLRLEKPVKLYGYFQSFKYLMGLESLLREDFQLRSPLTDSSTRLRERLAGGTVVGFHIRRGDYVANPHTYSVHGTVPLNYYQQAAKMIGSQLTGPVTYFCVTDDIAWARNHVDFLKPIVFCEPGTPDFEDLFLLSQCDHQIIANSSFSWWAAWLNPNPTKTVVAPKQWLRNSTADRWDLLPPEWIRI